MLAFLPESMRTKIHIMKQEFPPLLVYPEAWTSLGLLLAISLFLVTQRRWFPRRGHVALLAFWTLATLGLVVRWWFMPARPFSQNWTYLAHLLLLLVPPFGLALTFFRDFLGRRPELRQHIRPVAEKLIAFGIVCFVIYILWPVSSNGRRRTTRRGECRINLKQLGLAMHNYHDTFARFPASAGDDPPMSWRVALLPYIDQPQLFNAYDQARRWDERPNVDFVSREVRTYRCPSVVRPTDDRGRCFTSYIAPVGSHTILQRNESKQIKDVIDGVSNTLLLVEACGLEILWTDPRDFDVSGGPIGINLKGHGQTDSPGLLSSYHRGGANALLADGSVRFLSQQTAPAVLNALLTADGGDSPSEEW